MAISVTAMADVGDERAGLASGLMTTAHEIGAAFGVAIFSAIALGAGATGAAFADGHGEGSLAGGLIAAALALLALVALPAFRPAGARTRWRCTDRALVRRSWRQAGRAQPSGQVCTGSLPCMWSR